MGDLTHIIKIKREIWADPGVALPSYESSGAAGADIRANFPLEQRDTGHILVPGDRALIPTGLSMEIGDGYEVQVRPRSGLAMKHGVTLVNAPGTIDSDYRGAVGVLLVNLGAEPFAVQHGERVAQLVVAPVIQAKFQPVGGLAKTQRGTGGFGSTGAG